MKYVTSLILLMTGCASAPKCGNPPGANTIYAMGKTCEIRIRQVVVGSKMQIPDSLKGPEISSNELTWSDTALVDGKIQVGHFVLLPTSSGGPSGN